MDGKTITLEMADAAGITFVVGWPGGAMNGISMDYVGLLIDDPEAYWSQALGIRGETLRQYLAWADTGHCTGTTKKGRPCTHSTSTPRAHTDRPKDFRPGITNRCPNHVLVEA